MAVIEQSNQSDQPGIVTLTSPSHKAGRNPWMDAWMRLRKNRAALVGIFIILTYILAAIFAPLIAPREPNAQILSDNNAVPEWVIMVFPKISSQERDIHTHTHTHTYTQRDIYTHTLRDTQ